jgi:hypothetical protein
MIKPDVTNEDSEYWEQILESYGLGKLEDVDETGDAGALEDDFTVPDTDDAEFFIEEGEDV